MYLTIDEIRVAFEKEILALIKNKANLIPLKQVFTLTDAKIYVGYKIVYSETVALEKGYDGLRKRSGAIYISVLSPLTTNIKDDNNLAQEIENYFSMKRMRVPKTDCTYSILCESATTYDIGLDSNTNRYEITVMVPFFCWN